jgi:hypothetical protein
LREWLNNEFYNTLTSEQKKTIMKNLVVNSDNMNTPGGNNTQDKIFLLSIEEAERYFKNNEERIAFYKGNREAWWWLRSPGYGSDSAAIVFVNGNVIDWNIHHYGSVRPALWVNLES